jgi:hypothetical protein
MADLDFIDIVGTIMGLFIIGCFLASIVRRLYIGGRHDYLHDMNARRY